MHKLKLIQQQYDGLFQILFKSVFSGIFSASHKNTREFTTINEQFSNQKKGNFSTNYFGPAFP